MNGNSFSASRMSVWLLVLAAVWGLFPGRAAAARPSAYLETVPGQTVEPDPTKIVRIEFELVGKSWKEVFEWLSSKAGLPVNTWNVRLFRGTFTFVGPKGARYTVAEIVGILNQSLVRQGYVLVQRPRSFVVVGFELAIAQRTGVAPHSPETLECDASDFNSLRLNGP